MVDEPSEGARSANGRATVRSTRSVEASDRVLDGLFDALANRRRRDVLSYLEGADADTVEFRDLVAAVVDAEADRAAGTGYDERVALALCHAHLPKLERAGLVEYDPRAGTVRYRGHPLVERCLSLVEETRTG